MRKYKLVVPLAGKHVVRGEECGSKKRARGGGSLVREETNVIVSTWKLVLKMSDREAIQFSSVIELCVGGKRL